MSASTMEIKNIFEMNREELADYNQNKLIEFKDLFLNTDLPVDEITTFSSFDCFNSSNMEYCKLNISCEDNSWISIFNHL